MLSKISIISKLLVSFISLLLMIVILFVYAGRVTRVFSLNIMSRLQEKNDREFLEIEVNKLKFNLLVGFFILFALSLIVSFVSIRSVSLFFSKLWDVKEQGKNFRLSFENAKDGIVWVNPESGLILDCNKAFEILLQRSRNEIIGFPIKDIYVSEKVVCELKNKEALLRKNMEDITRTHETTLNVLDTLEKSKEALINYSKELESSNKDLEQFAMVASHDLQEPLRKIRNFSELFVLKYKGHIDEKADKYLWYITDASMRMQNLIQDILLYSKMGCSEPKMESIDLTLLIPSVLDDLALSISEQKAQIFYQDLSIIVGNPNQIHEVFLNLIGNAIKFRGNEPPQIFINLKDSEKEWLFSIKDNGIGIAPVFYERIFQPFQRLHSREEYPGTGMGLAICKKILERHGGRIWVESTVGKGTTIYFSLQKKKAASLGGKNENHTL